MPIDIERLLQLTLPHQGVSQHSVNGGVISVLRLIDQPLHITYDQIKPDVGAQQGFIIAQRLIHLAIRDLAPCRIETSRQTGAVAALAR